MVKMKLWKVVCNGIGWSKNETFYFPTRTRAEAFMVWFLQKENHVCDGVKYAGRFSLEHAHDLLELTEWTCGQYAIK